MKDPTELRLGYFPPSEPPTDASILPRLSLPGDLPDTVWRIQAVPWRAEWPDTVRQIRRAEEVADTVCHIRSGDDDRVFPFAMARVCAAAIRTEC